MTQLPEVPIRQDVGDPTVHPFRVFEFSGGVKGNQVGGSFDNSSAVDIACTYWHVMQVLNVRTGYCVAVFDSTDVLVALVGQYGVGQFPAAPVEPPVEPPA